MEEELVAGESPDKSVEQGSSGAAASTEQERERDPRLSVLRPRDPEPQPKPKQAPDAPEAADDPLRAAVAAWVATADADADIDATADAPGEPDAASDEAAPAADPDERSDAAEAVSGSTAEPADEAPAEDASADEAPGAKRPAASKPTDSKPTDSKPTDSKPAAEERPEPAGARPAGAPADSAPDSERTAVFRAFDRPARGNTDSASVSAPAAERPAADGAAAAARPAAESADSGADAERTTVFRAVRRPVAETPAPAAKKDSASDSGSDSDSESDSASASASASAAGRPKADAPADSAADSERTAVFRAFDRPVARGTAPAPDKADGTGSDSGSRPGAAPAKPAGGAAADAGTKRPEPADEESDSERTAVFRAVKPGSAAGEKKPSGGPATGSASERGRGDSKDAERVHRGMRDDSEDSASTQEHSGDSGDSEKTAVFRAVRPPAAPSVTDENSGWFRQKDAGPGAGTGTGSGPAAPRSGGDGERASTFVPLRTDEDLPRPAQPGQQPKAAPKGQAPAAAPAPGPAPAPAPAAPTPAADVPAPPLLRDGTERTTQQPLPPRPPLDLLAELSNNPPPPPSALRTTMRRVKIYTPFVVLLAVVLGIVQLVRPLPEPTLVMTAKTAYTFEGAKPELPYPSQGQSFMAAAGLGTVGSSGEQKPVPIASVTKSMTAYIILRDHPLKPKEKGPMIEVDKTAELEGQKDKSDNESTLNTVKEGDKISEYDALAALMLPSANNIARLLARWDAGSQEAFVKKMNDTARELGMTNTTYTDPSGLDATTVSTAEDQVKLGLKLVEIKALTDITSLPEWTDPSGKKWRNWNDLVPFNNSLGIKTGSTTKAGGNLLFAAYKEIGGTRQLVVGAVLAQHKPPILGTAINASKQMMLSTQKLLTGAKVVKKGDVVGYVDDGLGGHTQVVATKDVEAIGWPSVTVTVKLADGGKLPQSATAGTEVGMLTVGEGASQVKVPVALKTDLAAPGIGSKLTRIG
ncbi:hypothetical protein [Streptomyces sp. NPDC048603]|uniref:hypothetical protein n=1 Tax=Streptomyces sp. NPDC048603 TaxID=3365577 RepID=UPI00371CAC98